MLRAIADHDLVEAHAALEHGHSSPVDELLQSRFAFTDPRGVVTRWGAGAETLFGLAAEQVVGQPLFEATLAGVDAGWRAFLHGEQSQSPSALLEVSVTRPDERVFPCDVFIVPVLLADGLDFSQFAADLTGGSKGSPEAFGQRHHRVLGLIDGAARDGVHYAEGERLAGLIAIFRSAAEGPVTEGERIDEALVRAQRAERELEDLRDPVERAGTDFAELRTGLEGLRERLEALEARSSAAPDVHALAGQIERDLAGPLEDAVARRVEEALAARIEDALAARVEDTLGARIDEAVASRLDAVLADRIEGTLGRRLEETLPRTVEEAVSHGLDAALEGRPAPPPATGGDEALAGRVEDAVAARVEQALAGRIEQALATAAQAREEAEQVGLELRARRVGATKPLPIGFYSADAHPIAPDRPSVPGFDDLATPLATLTLEGRFIQLNEAFRDLVGYSEEEFASARWPSAADPEQLQDQRELRRALAAGEVEGAPIETAYMHREGLLVPLRGRMSVVRNEHGVPDHLLFSVEPA